MMDYKKYDLRETCRTCLKTNDSKIQMLWSIFSFHNNIIDELIIMELKITLDDGLPQQICMDCMNRLKEFYAFRTKSKNSQEILLQYFNKSDDIVAKFEQENLRTSNIEFVDIKDEVIDTENYNVTITAGKANVNTTSLVLEVEKCDINSLKPNDGGKLIEALQENRILHDNNKITNQNVRVNEMNLNDSVNRCITTSHVNVNDSVHGIMGTYQPEKKKPAKSKRRKRLDNYKVVAKNKKDGIPKCKYCKEIFNTMAAMKIHVNNVHPCDRPHLCPICEKGFKKVSNRNVHMETHVTECAFQCDKCNSRFKSERRLNSHKQQQHFMGIHHCPHCPKTFNAKYHYDYHILKLHTIVSTDNEIETSKVIN